MVFRAWISAAAVVFGTGMVCVQAPMADAAEGCQPGVLSDFNGDGWSDAVVGDPVATVAGQPGAGRLVVVYGDSDGRVGEGRRAALWQGAQQVGDSAEAGDRFATSLAVADVDCDGYTDVVVGVPGEDAAGAADAGSVHVLWGGAAGLAMSEPSTIYTRSSFRGSVQAGDRFGTAVDAVEDASQGGTPSPSAFVIAIGVPGADIAGGSNAGAIAVQAPADGGSVSFWITQDTPGIPGVSEAGDRFGAAVSCNYLSGDRGLIDCAVGVPNEDIGSRADAGAAILVQDIYFDDELVGLALDQNAPGVPGMAEAGDRYGSSIDTVQVGAVSRLAVGAPGEDVGPDANAGLVQLFSSTASRLSPGIALTQDTAGVSGVAESGDGFGASLAWAAPGRGDGQTRLAVGVPREDTTSGVDAGLVQVFRMSSIGAEVTWSQDSPGVPGAAKRGDRFGTAVAVIAGAAERVLLVGVPDDTEFAAGMVNVIPFAGGQPRSWVPGGAIPTAGASGFGASLGSVSSGAE